MKKLFLLAVGCSMLFAEEPSTVAEDSLVETFNLSEENTSTSASETFIINVEPSTLPEVQAPPAVLMPTKDVELSTETPAAQAPIKNQTIPKTALPAPTVQQIELNLEEDIAAIVKEEKEVADEIKSTGVVIDLGQVFAGSPTIYSILFVLSIASVGIWAYTLLSLRKTELLPLQRFQTLKEQLQSKNYALALETCATQPSLLFGMIATAIKNRHQGSRAMLEMMKAEGRRISTSYWQKIGILSEIAIIAPMLGLLGTVLGMFYAFYDLNRSAESISALFDGLGISVGTTVGGLLVAILALIFHAMTKYRLMRQLTLVESEAESLAESIQEKDLP